MKELKTVEAKELRDFIINLLEAEVERKEADVNQDTDFHKLIGLIQMWESVVDEDGRLKIADQNPFENIPEGYNSDGEPI